jgi:hypothetical protein
VKLERAVNDLLTRLFWAERRIDPYIRPAFDLVLRGAIQSIIQWIVVRRLPNRAVGLGEEHEIPGEQQATEQIVALMSRFLTMTYPKGHVERAGNSKTYGVVRGEFTVRDDVPSPLRHGLFATAHSYSAWVRFSGPGPFAPPDLRDNAIMSIGVKIIGVPGRKLLPDESTTQDLLAISAPTFTTPDVVQNALLQAEIGNQTPLLYFIRPSHPHLCDLIMQGLYAKTAASPLQEAYFSCVPYRLGPSQATQYRIVPRPFPGLAVRRRPGPNYLREAMATTLRSHDVTFDVLLQVQTDAHRMPIEHAGVVWSERLSPPIPVATLHLPAQTFDSPKQLAFADVLSFNPWHAMPEHRPLGNQGRARKIIYTQLAAVRQHMNGSPHLEPTGTEEFPP